MALSNVARALFPVQPCPRCRTLYAVPFAWRVFICGACRFRIVL